MSEMRRKVTSRSQLDARSPVGGRKVDAVAVPILEFVRGNKDEMGWVSFRALAGRDWTRSRPDHRRGGEALCERPPRLPLAMVYSDALVDGDRVGVASN